MIPLLSPTQLPVAIADSILWENNVDFEITFNEENFLYEEQDFEFLMTYISSTCKEYFQSLGLYDKTKEYFHNLYSKPLKIIYISY